MPLLSTLLPIEFFLGTSLIFLCGMLIEIWMNIVHLSYLDKETLQSIEKKHPQLPSSKTISTIAISAIILMIVSVGMLGGWKKFFETKYGIYSIIYFVDVCVAIIAIEIQWKGIRELFFGFVLGTSISLIFEIVREQWYYQFPLTSAFFIVLLCGGLILSWQRLLHEWTPSVRIMTAVSCIAWLSIFLLLR